MTEMLEDVQLLSAFWMTIRLAAWSAVFALILGTIVAMLVLTAVSAAAMYVAYKDVYGVAMPPESVIVPPAPPSPPTV